MIVKFKDGVSAASRVSALSSVSRTATMSTRSASQDFDVVQIAAGEDAESTARAFRARADVEYAQAAYRVHPAFVPNDQFYSIQWNLPLIDMERAWDIQPAGGSAITVAVLDTGIAYTRRHACTSRPGRFTVDADGNVGPPGSWRHRISGARAPDAAVCRRDRTAAGRRGSWRRTTSSGTTR